MAGFRGFKLMEINSNWFSRLVVATQTFFDVSPNFGKMIQFDEHIFQVGGWFNHQLETNQPTKMAS